MIFTYNTIQNLLDKVWVSWEESLEVVSDVKNVELEPSMSGVVAPGDIVTGIAARTFAIVWNNGNIITVMPHHISLNTITTTPMTEIKVNKIKKLCKSKE